jgi:signal transduction histidine kinase
MAAIGHTASTVFHQIARHHGAIGIFAHLLARGPAGNDPARWMTNVHDHAKRILASLEEAKRVIDELLRFGQDRSLNLYPHSFAALVRECVGDCDARAERRQVALVLAPVPEATLLLDKHKVKQAIANLVDNAIDATPAGERVEIEATLDGPVARITVRDHGTGVPETIRPRLFTPFCTTKTDGIGLGLALARELAEAHGGSVVWRPASPGAVFVLTLPHHPASPAADEHEGNLYSTSSRTRA